MKDSKKLVILISLVVLVATNILSPLSYAMAGEEDIVNEDNAATYLAGQDEGEIQNDGGEINDNPELESMTDQQGNNEQDENGVESGLSGEDGGEINDNPESESMTDQQGNNEQDENEVESGLSGEETTQNDEQEGSDLEDMPKMGGDKVTPIDILDMQTLDFEKNGELQVQDIDTSIITYGNTLYTVSTPLEGNGGDTMNNFKYKTITIGEGDDAITIMDRNLGATDVWTYVDTREVPAEQNVPGEYGYYYQWGNNHGFKPGITPTITGDKINVNGYGPINSYSSPIWVTDYQWRNGDSGYDLWGDISNTSIARQGPCPTDWHVPSSGEWLALYNLLGNTSDGKGLSNALKLPPSVLYNTNHVYGGDNPRGYYWSTSPNLYYFFFKDDFINPVNTSMNYSNGLPIRCFKNKYEPQPITITFNLNGGYWTEEGESSTGNKTKTFFEEAEGSLTNWKTPSKEPTGTTGWMFDGWYLENGARWTGNMTSDMTVYAHWLPFEDLVVIADDGTKITVMDRNLGATAAGTGCSTSDLSTCGYHFQWGNNYGFKPCTSSSCTTFPNGEITGDTARDAGDYAASTYYGSKFRLIIWSSVYNPNLWGGSGDTKTVNGAGTEVDRQGPCPDGYHVPSTKEWNDIYTALGLSSNAASVTTLMTKFKLPFVGDRNYLSASTSLQDGYYWSSSFCGSDQAYYLRFASTYISPQDFLPRANGFSVRCFKNAPQLFTVTFNPNGGEVEGESSLTMDNEGKVTLPGATREPNENGERVFEGWFASTGVSEKIGNSGDIITLDGDMTAYAHWAQTITIFDPKNPLVGFTILDRNLGAVSSGIDDVDSYGFYYQWGNNHGHLSGEEMTASETRLEYKSKYDGHGYDGEEKRHINIGGYPDIWENNNSYPNLWGGGSDSLNESNGFVYGFSTGTYSVNNVTDRQGPCPDGYHVPSYGERAGILNLYYESINQTGLLYNYGTIDVSVSDGDKNFINALHLPYAGHTWSNFSTVSDDGLRGYYWTSSPASNAYQSLTKRIDKSSGSVDSDSNSRAYGYSVRCFKDEYVAPTPQSIEITYDPNGGAFSGKSVNETTVVTYTKNASGTYEPDINIQFPNKTGYMFDGWYTSGINQTPAIEWTGYVSDDTTVTEVFARWLEFKDLDLNFSGVEFTIMDRNLGAELPALGTFGGNHNPEDINKLGKYYQWGNNYGFHIEGNKTISNIQIPNTSEYGPGNYYSSATFITGNDSWSVDNNENLWGGLGLTGDKQGPCPVGYHIPSNTEWADIITAYGKWSSTPEGTAFCANYNYIECFTVKLQLPFASALDSPYTIVGAYWSSSAYSTDSAWMLSFYMGDISPAVKRGRTQDNPVRCFKDKPNVTNKIIFNANGGIITTDSIQVTSGTSLDLTKYTATKTDYEFIGWNIDSGATTKIGDSYEVNGDVTLYAIFKKIPSAWTIESGDFRALHITGADGKVLFTIMDRNLGADAYMNEDGKTASQWYGKYYQWGNNYGFPNTGSVTTATGQVNITAGHYGSGNYYNSGTFIEYDGRWDIDTSNVTYEQYGNLNLWGDETNTDEARQGPCPTNWHVPSSEEWKAAVGIRCTKKRGGASTTACNDNLGSQLGIDLKLPYAGYRDGSNSNNWGSLGLYWSSSPNYSMGKFSYNLRLAVIINPKYVYSSRTFAFSVRCFQNTTGKTLSYVLNSGTNNADNPNYAVRRWEEGATLLSGTRNGYTFKGWYDNPDFTGDVVTTNALSTDDNGGTITLYAKWESDCPDGEEYVESREVCLPSRSIIRDSVSGEIIQINDQEWDDLELYFLQSDGSTGHYTIMDRNMGATEVYNQNFGTGGVNTGSFGYHYQWGNNYGFKPCINTSSNQNTCEDFPNNEDTTTSIPKSIWGEYMPSKYARNTWHEGTTWMASGSSNDNIWGGAGDYSDRNGNGTKADRQGPCPNGYYIPSVYDWITLKNTWGVSVSNANSGTQFASDLLLPSAGRRNYAYSEVGERGTYGIYRSSSPNNDKSKAFNITLTSSRIYSPNQHYRSNGYSVRCVKASPNTSSFTLHANGGTGAVIAFTGTAGNGKFTALGTPSRANSVFTGWYDAESGGNKIEKGSTVVQDLYARFECNSGYIDLMDGNGCVKSESFLMTGYNLGTAISSLAGNSSNIEVFTWSGSMPSDSIQKINIAMAGIPTYAWYDTNSKTIYYYSDADVIYMNKDINSMFYSFSNLKSVDLSRIDMSNVEKMYYMFLYCRNLESVNFGNFEGRNVTDMHEMFENCGKLTNVDLGNFVGTNVTNMHGMFNFCYNLTSVNLSSLVGGESLKMDYMFSECKKLQTVDLGNFVGTGVTDMGHMFYNCISLTGIDLGSFVGTNVTNMDNMFYYATGLISVDLGNFDGENVTKTSYMFMGCQNLKTVNLGNFVGPKVTITQSMFESCKSLTNIDLGKFKGQNLTSAANMFYYCTSLTGINLGNFIGTNLTNMQEFVVGCNNLETLDLSSLNPTNLTDTFRMFDGASKLKTVYVGSSFNPNNITSSYGMFDSATFIVGGNGTKFDSEYITGIRAKIDNEYQTGYFTDPRHFAIRFRNLSGDEITTQWISTGGNAQTLTGRYKNYEYYTQSGDIYKPFSLDTPLYAYTEIYASGQYVYEVKFYSGDDLLHTLYVTGDNQSKIGTMPESPEIQGLDFAGWTIESSSELFNPNDVITGDLELYATWHPNGTGYEFDAGCFKYETLGLSGSDGYIVEVTDYLSGNQGCSLVDVTVPGKVNLYGREYTVYSVGEGAFYGEGFQGVLTLQEGIKEIKRHGFNRNSITGLVLPNSLISIDYYGFNENRQLLTISFGNSLETLGTAAFKDCGLVELQLPASLKTIGTNSDWNGVFENNVNLQTVVFNEGLEFIGGNAFKNTGIRSVNLPSTVLELCHYAFSSGANLTEINLNEGLLRIGNYAFGENPLLTGIVIPSTVTSIGYYIFGDSYSSSPIEKLIFNAKNFSATSNTFNFPYLRNLNTVVWNGSGKMADNLFSYSTVENLSLGQDVTEIGSHTFGNTQIRSLTIPGNVKIIGNDAFSEAPLETLVLEEGIQSIGSYAFSNNLLSELVIPDSVDSIGSYSFTRNSGGKIDRCVIGDGLTDLKTCNFGYCEDIEIGDGVTSITYSNFCGDPTILKKIKIGDGVTNINQGTFLSMRNIEEIEIGNGLVQIQQGVFGGTPSLTSLKLGNSLTTIGTGEFSGALFSRIDLPNSLTTLGEGVFCSDDVKDPESIIGVISGATNEQIELLENGDNTECFLIKKDKYNVKLSRANEGSDIVVELPYNSEFDLSAYSGTKSGWHFEGWANDPISTGALTENPVVTGELILYPIFKKTLYAIFNPNGSQLNGGDNPIPGTCDIYNSEISCTVQAPTIIPSSNTTIEIGFNTGANATTNHDNYNTGTKLLTLYESISGEMWYAITKSDDITLNITYGTGVGVTNIGKTGDSCIITGTYNGASQATGCTVIAPDITLKSGYGTGIWTKNTNPSIEVNPGNAITISSDNDAYTASATPNTHTLYTVHYYLENVDNENYTLDSTDDNYGTTDDVVSVNELKKGITGAHFEKAAIVVNPQGPEHGATDAVDSITIDGNGNTEVYLFYKRNVHTVSATAGEGVGSVIGTGGYKYGQTVTLTPQDINPCYTANPITFTMPDNDVQITLSGTIKTFTVALQKDEHIATVSGADTYDCGAEVTITATPSTRYEFNAWMSGSTQISTQSSYTFTLTGNVTYKATSRAMDGTKFIVKHWIKNVNANTYTKYSEEDKSGETDSVITLANYAVSVPCGTYVNGSEDGGVDGVGTPVTTTTISANEDTVINLFYNRNSYTVTISADSGIQSVNISAPYQDNKYECGAEVILSATPKTGYHFTTYSSEDVDSSTSNPYIFTMPDKAVSIQAQSNANTYTVKFNANGGRGTMSSQTFIYDVAQELSDNLFTKTGYIFTGWSSDSGATVPTYTNKQSVSNLATTGSVTLYAVWTTQGTSTKYTVRHIKQGLNTPTDDVIETQELYAETNSEQTPAVNTYEGFYSPSTGTLIVTPNGDASIDYLYTRKDITIIFDMDNLGENPSISGKYDTTITKPGNPSKSGYTFVEWLPAIPDTFPATNETYVAQYTLDTYTITYHMNSGTNHVDNPTSYTYLSGAITLKSPTREGYVFNGWTGTNINGISKNVTIPTNSEGNREYTAVWGEDKNNNGIDDAREPKYTVKYTDGVAGEEIFADEITNNLLSGFATPTFNGSTGRANYIFAGWNPAVRSIVTGNQTYTATWYEDFNGNNINDATEPHFTVRFLSGEHGDLSGKLTYDNILSGLTLNDFGYVEPTKIPSENYMFSGWNMEINPSEKITRDLTYTSIWGEDFNHNGENDESEPKYKITVNYNYISGSKASETVSGEYLSGITYSFVSPTIQYYTADVTELSGITTSTQTYNVIYRPVNDTNKNNIADEQETKYKVTVNYVYSRGGTATGSVSGMYLSGVVFSFVSPTVRYYTPNSGTVTGTGKEEAQTFTVTYSPNADTNRNGIADEEELHYILTIHYVNGSGGKVYDDYSGSYVSGANYSITSPLRTYYTIQTGGEVISGVMGTGNIERTVVYLANNDTNGNGIADEEEVKPSPSGGGGSSGGGGGGGGKRMPTIDEHGSAGNAPTSGAIADDPTTGYNKSDNISDGQHGSGIIEGAAEMEQAYNFSYKNGITTVNSFEKAKMYGNLTRIQMAKMLSYFAINVLGQKPNTLRTIEFTDVSDRLNAQYDNAVVLAYQLGIMGINMKNNEFRPNDEVTRAEFATALSRLLYKTDEGKYKSTGRYYEPHIAKLYNEGIITKTDPNMKEKRGYVMLMLMRSTEKFNIGRELK